MNAGGSNGIVDFEIDQEIGGDVSQEGSDDSDHDRLARGDDGAGSRDPYRSKAFMILIVDRKKSLILI